MANNKKQKLIIQDLLSSPEIYTRTSGILKPSYFDQEYEPIVAFIHEYYGKYSATPAVDQIAAEFDLEIEATVKVSRDRVESTCDDIEKFCKETAVKEAIYNSLEDIENQEMSRVLARVTEAVNISLQRDMGVDLFNNPEELLRSLIDDFTPIPTGIDGIDGPLDGGLIRQQFTLFSANSGGGKSVMLANIGANYALRGYDVLYISLELPAEMVFLRLASIISGYDTSNWKGHIPEISSGIIHAKNSAGGGSYIIKKMSQHSTAADFRSYLSFYEMEYGKLPDVFLVDYLDLMDPNSGAGNLGIFEQDKRKSEEVVDILQEYDMIGISASQQNRDAISMTSPNQSIIAGGISKVNTVDNYISLFMDDTMRLEGEMNAYFLKTRSSRGVGHCSILNFNSTNLRISNLDGGGSGVMPRKRKAKADMEDALAKINEPKVPEEILVNGLPGMPEDDEPEVRPMFDDADQPPIMPKIKATHEDFDELQNLIKDFAGED
jgi:hypothetical protein